MQCASRKITLETVYQEFNWALDWVCKPYDQKECTFSAANWKMSWDQHETFRFIWQFLSGRHRNKYSLILKEVNCISQSYHSSLSYIIRWSDFQVNGLQRVQLLTETVLQYSTWMLSKRRGHSIDVSDNICGWICGFSLQMPFQIIIFCNVSDSASSFSIFLRRSCSWIFWNFQNIIQEKQHDGV